MTVGHERKRRKEEGEKSEFLSGKEAKETVKQKKGGDHGFFFPATSYNEVKGEAPDFFALPVHSFPLKKILRLKILSPLFFAGT